MVGVPRGPLPRSLLNSEPLAASHSFLPVARSNAWMYSVPPRLPTVNSLPPAVLIDEYPVPAPPAFHASGGPPVGHCDSRPVSAERPSRFGPRHCGQSVGDLI